MQISGSRTNTGTHLIDNFQVSTKVASICAVVGSRDAVFSLLVERLQARIREFVVAQSAMGYITCSKREDK